MSDFPTISWKAPHIPKALRDAKLPASTFRTMTKTVEVVLDCLIAHDAVEEALLTDKCRAEGKSLLVVG